MFVFQLNAQPCNKMNLSFPSGYFNTHWHSSLDPQTQKILNDLNKNHQDLNKVSLEDLRKAEIQNLPLKSGIVSIKNIAIEGPLGPVKLRLYYPASKEKSLPVFIYLHGGGWVLGSVEEYDSLCQEIALQAHCLVVSVDYHLAPEHPFPQPLNDCYFASNWVANHIQKYGGEPKKIAIGGDSAGGNLTAAVTLLARERSFPNFLSQVLICPVTNDQFNTLSYYEYGHGFSITAEDMKFFWSKYLNHPAKGKNPLASPLKAECLANLPPALLIIADFDPLRDEGLAYGLRLHREGVPTLVKRFNSIHGFYWFEESDLSKEALNLISTWLHSQFSDG